MSQANVRWLACLVALLSFLGVAHADSAAAVTQLGPADCPPNMYSYCHYWAPWLHRFSMYCQGVRVPISYPEVQPALPPRYITDPKPCPAAEYNTYGFQR